MAPRQSNATASIHTSSQIPAQSPFLNVEAVAVALGGGRGHERQIHSAGFFEGIRDKTVEMNWEENPYPSLAIVRSLITAASLNYFIGPKLGAYLAHHVKRISPKELIAVQVAHYGYVRCSDREIEEWVLAISDQIHEKGFERAKLPIKKARQLELWKSGWPNSK